MPTRGRKWLSQNSPRRWNGSSVIWTMTSSSSVSGPTWPRAMSPTIQAAIAPYGGAFCGEAARLGLEQLAAVLGEPEHHRHEASPTLLPPPPCAGEG